MKAKVKLIDQFSGRNLVLICELVEDRTFSEVYHTFSYDKLSDFQRRKIESYFGKLNAYHTRSEIIKIL